MAWSGNDGVARSASPESAPKRICAALTAGTALAMLLAALGGAEAGSVGHGRHEQAKKEAPKALQVPLIAVSIANQRLTLYDKGQAVARAPISTGMQGHPTPTGVFSVLEKEVFHRSTIYSGAPMPYMQRITWSGVALHAGVLPGYPASHGCIRMPHDFAVKLFGLTQRGARVIVSRGGVKPVAFDNPHLFTLSRPTDTRPGERTTTTGAGSAVKTAETKTPAVMSDASDAAARTLAGIDKPTPGETAPAEPAKAGEGPRAANPSAIVGAHAQAIQAVGGEPQKPAPEIAAKDAAAGPAKGTAPVVARADLGRATPQATDAAAKGHDTVGAGASAPGAGLGKPVAIVPPQPIEVKKTFDPDAVPPTPESEALPAPAPTPQAVLEPYGPERPLRPGPITVFVSKKEGKVFVRKGFQQILAERVSIADPELALGTHMFTAVAAKPDGTSFDWVEVSVPTSNRDIKAVKNHRSRRVEKGVAPAIAPPPTTAAEALDRIEFPPDALSRISSLMSAGATLIISDQGLGPETGLDTDFVVLTH